MFFFAPFPYVHLDSIFRRFCCEFKWNPMWIATMCVWHVFVCIFVCFLLCCSLKRNHVCVVVPGGTFVGHLSLPCVTHCLGIGELPTGMLRQQNTQHSTQNTTHRTHSTAHHGTQNTAVLQIYLSAVKCEATVRHCYRLLACRASGFQSKSSWQFFFSFKSHISKYATAGWKQICAIWDKSSRSKQLKF